MEQEQVRISSKELEHVLEKVLEKHGMQKADARICAEVFTLNSVDGVYSHGFNRFPKFIEYLKLGYVMPGKKAALRFASGSIEQWDGQLGPGPLNALLSTQRSIELARQYGMGCVALANTNHWMRGGTYGWKAADAGFVFIGWSNTISNMPPWGSKTPKLGNNPLVIAVPRAKGALVLDMAMSQYSYGALEMQKMKNEKLSVSGGYNNHGKLTNDPQEIITSRRPLPIGYWKGSGLSLMLDILATILSAGLSTAQISQQNSEYGLSQVFIAIDLSRLSNFRHIGTAIDQILQDYYAAEPDEQGKSVRYPGEQVLKVREENLRLGVPMPVKVWDEIQKL
jgi:3-dehydro-L-gulonate 2-dehydrogenase